MPKYPCGICDNGVKYQGIYCTGLCKSWYHSKCLNWPDKKFKNLKNEEIINWMCDKCKPYNNYNEIEIIESKIHDLSHNGTLDHETSLALAAEVGNALFNENKILKQKLHETKLYNVEHYLTLEDNLMKAEETIKGLIEDNNKLSSEMTLIKNKLEKERTNKEEIIQDAEKEKEYLSNQLSDLSSCNSKLRSKIQDLETDIHNKYQNIDNLQTKNDNIMNDLKYIKAELVAKTTLINKINCKSEELALKLSEQESLTRSYLNSLLEDTKSHLTSVTTNTEEQNKKNKISQLIKSPNKSVVNVTRELLITNQTKDAVPLNICADKTTLNSSQNALEEQNEHTTDVERRKSETTKKMPPLSAKILKDGESFESFFNREIENFKKSQKKEFPKSSNKLMPKTVLADTLHSYNIPKNNQQTETSVTETERETQNKACNQNFLEEEQKTKARQKSNFSTKIYLNTSLKSMKTRRRK